jgi:hypothetical protein
MKLSPRNARVCHSPTATLAGQKQMEPIKVFVFSAADPEGFVDANSQQRHDSVEDLRKDLSKNSFIQIVSVQGTADVTLEVLGRGHEETGSTTDQPEFLYQNE